MCIRDRPHAILLASFILSSTSSFKLPYVQSEQASSLGLEGCRGLECLWAYISVRLSDRSPLDEMPSSPHQNQWRAQFSIHIYSQTGNLNWTLHSCKEKTQNEEYEGDRLIVRRYEINFLRASCSTLKCLTIKFSGHALYNFRRYEEYILKPDYNIVRL